MASVTVHVYVPAVKLVAVWVVLPFDQKYVYGGVPPLTETFAVPLPPPLQLTFVVDEETVIAAGSVIACVIGFPEYAQLFASNIFIVCIPGVKLGIISICGDIA